MKLNPKAAMSNIRVKVHLILPASNFQLISRFLERISDHAVKIAKNVKKIDFKKIDKKRIDGINNASQISLKLLNMSLDAWLGKKIDLANQNIESISELTDACEEIISEEVNPDYAVEISNIIESIQRTGEYSADISEIIINNLI